MEEMKYTLEVFEGPLDLLLKLISRNKVKIEDIPISLILEQYLEHIEQMRRMDMDVAGEFITMAAELMRIKSRMLLPREEEEEDPRAALAAALLEYKRVKEAAAVLGEKYAQSSGRMVRSGDEIEGITVLLPHDAERLTKALDRVMARMAMQTTLKENIRRPEDLLGDLISDKPPYPVAGKVFGIIRKLLKRGEIGFEQLLSEAESRSELIATFVAVLELLKAQRIRIADDVKNDNDDTKEKNEGNGNDDGDQELILRLNREKKAV